MSLVINEFKEHLGGINEFLNKKKMDHLKSLNIKERDRLYIDTGMFQRKTV
jgi:hypothetical protein